MQYRGRFLTLLVVYICATLLCVIFTGITRSLSKTFHPTTWMQVQQYVMLHVPAMVFLSELVLCAIWASLSRGRLAIRLIVFATLVAFFTWIGGYTVTLSYAAWEVGLSFEPRAIFVVPLTAIGTFLGTLLLRQGRTLVQYHSAQSLETDVYQFSIRNLVLLILVAAMFLGLRLGDGMLNDSTPSGSLTYTVRGGLGAAADAICHTIVAVACVWAVLIVRLSHSRLIFVLVVAVFFSVTTTVVLRDEISGWNAILYHWNWGSVLAELILSSLVWGIVITSLLVVRSCGFSLVAIPGEPFEGGPGNE